MNQGGSRKNVSASRTSMAAAGAKVKKQNFRLELAGIIIVVLLAIAYSYHRFTKSLEFSPQKLYEKTFVESVSNIQDLQGESKGQIGFDSWIRFKCPAGATLRNAKEFKTYPSEIGRKYFEDKFPQDRSLKLSVDSYEYLTRSESGVGNVMNEALLVNKKNHDYFYRAWGL